VVSEPIVVGDIEYKRPLPAFPYSGVNWRKLEFREADPRSIEPNPNYKRYQEAGFRISSAREENLMRYEGEGAIVAVFEDPSGSLFVAGQTGHDGRTVYIARTNTE
jgi:hypothetical protein